MSTIAEETRAAVRARPFLLAALRAEVVNYAAAAEFLDVEGGNDAVAAALRRFADELPTYRERARDVTVRMRRGVGVEEGDGRSDPSLVEDGDLTALRASGDVDTRALVAVLASLHAEDVGVEHAWVSGRQLVVIVGPRAGPQSLRVVESTLAAVPD